MKKIVLILLCMLIFSPVYAAKMVVESLSPFTTRNPNSYFTVKVLDSEDYDNGVLFEKNSIIRGKVIEVVEPKRGKRNAYFILKPLVYTVPSKGNKIYKIKDKDWEAKVIGYKPFDLKESAKGAAVSVTNFFVQGFSTVYYFGKGVIHPDSGENRLVSGGKSVYKHSFLSYIDEGGHLNVRKGDYLALKFYHYSVPKWKFWERNG